MWGIVVQENVADKVWEYLLICNLWRFKTSINIIICDNYGIYIKFEDPFNFVEGYNESLLYILP